MDSVQKDSTYGLISLIGAFTFFWLFFKIFDLIDALDTSLPSLFQRFDLLVYRISHHQIVNASFMVGYWVPIILFFGLLAYAIVRGLRAIRLTEHDANHKYSRSVALVSTTLSAFFIPCGIVSFFFL